MWRSFIFFAFLGGNLTCKFVSHKDVRSIAYWYITAQRHSWIKKRTHISKICSITETCDRLQIFIFSVICCYILWFKKGTSVHDLGINLVRCSVWWNFVCSKSSMTSAWDKEKQQQDIAVKGELHSKPLDQQ